MYKVVDLAQAIEDKETGIQELNNFIKSAVELNKGRISLAIENEVNGENPQVILDTFTDHLLSHAFSNYSQSTLLEYIANGTLFKARELLFDSLIANEEINAAMILQGA
ncbi:hypothetical protein [Metabacillus sp. 22489]|uniref:hypothetical protein n=1 Tax=Metabacillus sp. 22489 TaxID=3453928 RepID=UPI003F876177